MKNHKKLTFLLCVIVAVVTVIGLLLLASAQEEQTAAPPASEEPESAASSAELSNGQEITDTTEAPTDDVSETESEMESGETPDTAPTPSGLEIPKPVPSVEPESSASNTWEPEPLEESVQEEIPEYPSGWAESGREYLKGNLDLAVQIRMLENKLDTRIEYIRDAFSTPEEISVQYDNNNLLDVIAIYAVSQGMTQDFPYNVQVSTEAQWEKLLSIFWSLTRVEETVWHVDGGRVYSLHVWRDGYDVYALTDTEREQVAALVAATPSLAGAIH